jgi:hypothetical protein
MQVVVCLEAPRWTIIVLDVLLTVNYLHASTNKRSCCVLHLQSSRDVLESSYESSTDILAIDTNQYVPSQDPGNRASALAEARARLA